MTQTKHSGEWSGVSSQATRSDTDSVVAPASGRMPPTKFERSITTHTSHNGIILLSERRICPIVTRANASSVAA